MYWMHEFWDIIFLFMCLISVSDVLFNIFLLKNQTVLKSVLVMYTMHAYQKKNVYHA
jgi:hypothetical protein